MSDIDDARRRNKAFVREQRRGLGLLRDEEDMVTITGIARLVIRVTQLQASSHSPDWDSLEKALRKNIAEHGRLCNRLTHHMLHSGDRELRAEWTQRVPRATAQKLLAEQDALRDAVRH